MKSGNICSGRRPYFANQVRTAEARCLLSVQAELTHSLKSPATCYIVTDCDTTNMHCDFVNGKALVEPIVTCRTTNRFLKNVIMDGDDEEETGHEMDAVLGEDTLKSQICELEELCGFLRVRSNSHHYRDIKYMILIQKVFQTIAYWPMMKSPALT